MGKWETVYCLFCEAQSEAAVIAYLRVLGLEAISPATVRLAVRRGREVRENRRMLPGYVFVYASAAPDFRQLSRISGVLRALKYNDGSYALTGADLAFAAWLYANGGVIDVSAAIQAGTKIKIIDGPLRDYGGRIVKVDKKRKSVAVEIGLGGAVKLVWASFALIEQAPEGA